MHDVSVVALAAPVSYRHAARERLVRAALDKKHFPSTRYSTHLIHPTGVAWLARGSAGASRRVGLPSDPQWMFDFGSAVLTGRARPSTGVAELTRPAASCSIQF